MQPYSKEFRAEVLAACDAGEERRAIALRFDVSESWVRRICQQRRETGQVAQVLAPERRPQVAAKTTRERAPTWRAWAEWLVAKITARPDIYLRELQAELKAERDVDVCLQTISTACQALEQSRKKRR